MDVLHEGLATKSVALAQEAFTAAKEIHARPGTARGGPWLSIKLSDATRAEIAAVARSRSLTSLSQIAADLGPRSRLAFHLQGLKFDRPASPDPASASASAAPSAKPVQVKRSRSGTRTPGKSGKSSKGSKSGARDPATKRGRDVATTQWGQGQSGAVTRFHKLPLLKKPASIRQG